MAGNVQSAQVTHGASRQTQPLVARHVVLSVWSQLLTPMSSGPQSFVHDVSVVLAGQFALSVSPLGQTPPVDPVSGADPSPVSLMAHAPTRAAIASMANSPPRARLEVFICSTASENSANPGGLAAPFQSRSSSIPATQDSTLGYPRFGDHTGFLQAVVLGSAAPRAIRGQAIGESHAAGQWRAARCFGLTD